MSMCCPIDAQWPVESAKVKFSSAGKQGLITSLEKPQSPSSQVFGEFSS